MIHLSFIILSRFSYFILLVQFYNLVFLDMQLLIELVFCNKKVKVRHGTIFLLILAKNKNTRNGIKVLCFLAEIWLSGEGVRVMPG